MSAPKGWTIDFEGKVIVVTGGNRGVGEGMSKALAEANASVAIIYNSAKDAEDVAAGIAKEYGIKCQAYQCDVGQADRVKQVFDQIEKEMGQIAGLIANAGICIVKKAIDMTKADFDKQFEVNVLGVFHTCQAAARLWMPRKQAGSIVIISSMSSQIVNHPLTQCFYNPSKAAVSNLGKCLASEWAPDNIRVNVVSPGFVVTAQTASNPQETRDDQASRVPLKRFSEAKEQTGQALLLLDNSKSSYQTGGEYFVDGGYLIW